MAVYNSFEMESIDYSLPADRHGITDILLQACAVAKIGWWEVNLTTRKPVWSDVIREIHEVPKNYCPTMEDALSFYKEGESRNKIQHAVKIALEYGIPFELEVILITAKKTEKWVKAIGFTEFKNGKCCRLYGTFQDIHQAKIQELKLKQSEEAFRKSFEYAAIGKAIVGIDGKWIRVNRSLCQLLGYSEQELLQLTFQDITYPDDLNADMDLLQEVLYGKRENYQMEKRYIHKNGHIVYALLSVSLIKDSNNKPDYFVSQITDISDRKQAEKDLANTITKLNSILDATTQVIIITTDTDGFITSFNKGAENLLEYKAEEVINKQTAAIFHDHKEIKQKALELSTELGKKINNFEVFTAKARNNEFYSQEWYYRKKSGGTFPVQLVITAIKNKEGELAGYLGIATDISRIKQAQNESLSLLDVLSDQNNRLKNFAHIVSHNLRSHSSNLSMLIELISYEPKQEMKDEMLSMLGFAADKLTETIHHLNDVVVMNNVTTDALKTLNLKDSLYNAIVHVSALIKNINGNVNINIDKNLTVEAVPAYLESIFNNLLTNAIKYHAPDRQLIINISAERQKDGVLLTIQDNGQGIDLKKNGHKIFGMYKTFHNNSDARGIGLFITKNQVEAMGGKIDVVSKVNNGTTFKVLLNEKN